MQGKLNELDEVEFAFLAEVCGGGFVLGRRSGFVGVTT